MRSNRFKTAGGLLVAFLLGLSIPVVSQSHAKTPDDIFAKLDIFAKVLHYVETNYVEPVSQKELIYGAIKGMLDTLDPHTMFMPPDVYREMRIDTTGEFQGLGIIVEKQGKYLTVIEPIEGSPAEREGLLPGDRILRIDDQDATMMSLAEATKWMRGPLGTSVSLVLERPGQNEPIQKNIVRKKILIHSVQSRLLDAKTGYLKIKSFQDQTAKQAKDALKELKSKAGGSLTGLVLDLRDNPGGLMDQAVMVADEFLEKGDIVSTKGRNPHQVEVERAGPSGSFQSGTLAVLVNYRSASAAEILAGALADHGRAKIIGNGSYGKGSVQNIIDLEDGSGLKITVAKYFTPSGKSIEGIGITPEIFVDQPDRRRVAIKGAAIAKSDGKSELDAATKKLLAAVPKNPKISSGDLQLQVAYAVARGK